MQKHLLTLIKWDPLTPALPNPEPFMPAREATKERTEWADNKGSATSAPFKGSIVCAKRFAVSLRPLLTPHSNVWMRLMKWLNL